MGNASLDAGQKVIGPHLQNAVHESRIQAYAASQGRHLPLQTAALSERHHRHAVYVGEAQESDYLFPAFREDDYLGQTGDVVAEPTAMALELGFPRYDPALLVDYPLELRK
jgi:hypothetical protein